MVAKMVNQWVDPTAGEKVELWADLKADA